VNSFGNKIHICEKYNKPQIAEWGRWGVGVDADWISGEAGWGVMVVLFHKEND